MKWKNYSTTLSTNRWKKCVPSLLSSKSLRASMSFSRRSCCWWKKSVWLNGLPFRKQKTRAPLLKALRHRATRCMRRMSLLWAIESIKSKCRRTEARDLQINKQNNSSKKFSTYGVLGIGDWGLGLWLEIGDCDWGLGLGLGIGIRNWDNPSYNWDLSLVTMTDD